MKAIPFKPFDFFGYLASGVLVVVAMEVVFGFPQVLGKTFGLVDGAVLLLGVYVAGHLIASPAKALLEDVLVRRVLGAPSETLMADSHPPIRGFLFPGYYLPLPAPVRKRIRSRARSEGVDCDGEVLFVHVRFSKGIRDNDKVMARLSEFLGLYGFARNISFTALVVAIGLFVQAYRTADEVAFQYGIVSLVAGVALLYRYLKFLRQYSYELFNTYLTL